MKKRIFAGIIAITMAASAIPSVLADELNNTYDYTTYDGEISFENTCDLAADGVTLNEGAPDGSKYYTTGDSQYTGIGGLKANTSADYMWEADVRFDDVASGFTVMGGKVGTCIRRYDETDGQSKLAVQTGSSDYTKYDEIDPDKWYHISLIGSYGTSAPLKMEVYEWVGGTMTLLNTYDNVNKRQNQSSRYIAVEKNTSVDNVRITKLGADTLTISTIPANTNVINAGETVAVQYSATRNGRDINKPAVEWKVYDGEEEIDDGTVTVTEEDGVKKINTRIDCTHENITVKAISTERGEVEGSCALTVNTVDLTLEKFDTISLSADNDYVRAGEPLALTVSASKGGEEKDISAGDIVWKFYDSNNIQDIGNKYITVGSNNELCVTEQVISQTINVRAESESGLVFSRPLKVSVKASDAVDIGETGKGDIILLTDAGENTSNSAIASGSWDGSHYYNITQDTNMSSVTDTTDDVIIEADIQFKEENSGINLRDSGNNKIGGQLVRQGDKIGRVGSGNKFTPLTGGNADDWYHIQITARCGQNVGGYGTVKIYKYASDGSLVNPETDEADTPASGALDMRTMISDKEGKPFSHIEAVAGTGIDNLRIMQLVPDEIRVSLSAETIFAGAKATATCAVLRKGVEIPSFPSDKILWGSSDSANITITNGEIETNALMNEKTVTIRAVLAANSEIAGEAELSVIGNDMFTITGFGLAEDNDNQISELRVRKNFFYSGDVVFIVALYDTDGALMQVAVRTLHDNTLGVGENNISIDPINLPSDFGSVKAMVWTSLGN